METKQFEEKTSPDYAKMLSLAYAKKFGNVSGGDFYNGYIRAINETNPLDLLEALQAIYNECLNKECTIAQTALKAIKKATE